MSIINAPEPIVQAVETRAHRIPSLPDVILEPLVRATLQEDLGRAGDLTTDSIVPATARTQMRLVAREGAVAYRPSRNRFLTFVHMKRRTAKGRTHPGPHCAQPHRPPAATCHKEPP